VFKGLIRRQHLTTLLKVGSSRRKPVLYSLYCTHCTVLTVLYSLYPLV
jgi:hypothetical protein